MGCGVWTNQINEIERALGVMSSFGISPQISAFGILRDTRTYLYSQIGVKLPRIISLLVKFVGLSPGIIALYHDSENGFLTEARATPSSDPVRKIIPVELAMKVLVHDISPELELFLMTPDENIDN